MASPQFRQIGWINASPIRAAVYCQILLTLSCSLHARADNPVGPDAAVTPKLSTDARNKIARAVVRDVEEKTVSASLAEEKNAPVQLEEIRILDSTEHQPREKLPIEKMHSFLDQVGQSRADSVAESTASDGARYAQINKGNNIYCIEERRGLIDFSGIYEKPLVTSPAGTKCRKGQY